MMSPLIHQRYRVVARIGRGAQGETFLARDERDGREVALKELDFAAIGSWDTVSLFEREAAVLGGLAHDNIPRIIESFRAEEDGTLRLFLVQEFVAGKDLAKRLADGELFDERRLRGLANAVLEVLEYLHSHSPPVLHRDIKPANLVQRPDGTVALVDFGAAQGSQQGEAVIGTTGYMPAEHLMGRAVPSSDLFALGATLIHLATRKHPSDLGEGLGLAWREYTNLSPRFSDWLDRMVAPMPEDRFPSAVAARRALREKERPARELRVRATGELDVPYGTPTLTRNGRYELRRAHGRLHATRRRRFPERRRALHFGLYLMTLAAVYAALAVLRPLAYAVIAAAIGLVMFRRWMSPRIMQIEGHERGLDIVWSGDEVVQRVALEDISGPDLIKITGGHALVVWTRSGERLTLDRQIGNAADARMLRAVLHAWLAQARRRR